MLSINCLLARDFLNSNDLNVKLNFDRALNLSHLKQKWGAMLFTVALIFFTEKSRSHLKNSRVYAVIANSRARMLN